MTIIMITHEPSIAKCAKTIYHILDGELRANAYNEEAADEE